jgi:hypothetical protein
MAAAASLLMARSPDADTSSTLLAPLGYDLVPEFSPPAVMPKAGEDPMHDPME